MDTQSAPSQPETPAELVAAVTCPFARFQWVTALARQHGHLTPEWSAQRRADLRATLTDTPRSSIATRTGLSRTRVHQLAAQALGECAP